MPVAQRGAQDDCTKIEVVSGGGGNNNGDGNNNDGGNNGGNNDNNNNGNANNGGNNGTDNNTGGGNNGGNDGGNNNNGGEAVPISSGTLGGAPPTVENSGDAKRPFSVNGNTFVNAAAAVGRACDIQFNACADGVNRGQITDGTTVNDCQTQRNGCKAA